MRLGEFRKQTKDLPDNTELVLWEWREDDKETRSYYWDLTPTMEPARHKGYFMLMENKYAEEIKFKKVK